MKIKIKLTHKDAKIPTYAHTGEDACVDLYAAEVSGNALSSNKIVVDFGVAFEIPAGYCALIFPRSSIHKKDLFLSNCVGVIDSGYRGNVKAVFYKDKLNFQNNKIEVGERCAQMMIIPVPTIEFEQVETLSNSTRGNGGYGSTGKI